LQQKNCNKHLKLTDCFSSVFS